MFEAVVIWMMVLRFINTTSNQNGWSRYSCIIFNSLHANQDELGQLQITNTGTLGYKGY